MNWRYNVGMSTIRWPHALHEKPFPALNPF
jgi:hypothetical protein